MHHTPTVNPEILLLVLRHIYAHSILMSAVSLQQSSNISLQTKSGVVYSSESIRNHPGTA